MPTREMTALIAIAAAALGVGATILVSASPLPGWVQALERNAGLPSSCYMDSDQVVECDSPQLDHLLGNKRIGDAQHLRLLGPHALEPVDLSSLTMLTSLEIMSPIYSNTIMESISTIPNLESLTTDTADLSALNTHLKALRIDSDWDAKFHQNFTVDKLTVSRDISMRPAAAAAVKDLVVLGATGPSVDLRSFTGLRTLSLGTDDYPPILPDHISDSEDLEVAGAGQMWFSYEAKD